jgi:probable phosphoglycerate mutase
LSQLLGIPITTTKAFRERHVGVLEGLTFDESKINHPKDYYALVNRNVHHVITEGESYRHLLKRATGQLWEVLRDHQGERIAVFSHTGAICFMTLHLMGAIRRDTKQTPWIVTSNCGINRFEIRATQHPRPRPQRYPPFIDITGNDAFAALKKGRNNLPGH